MNIANLIEAALKEDIATGDVTTDAIFTEKDQSTAYVVAKQDGVLCGIDFFVDTFKLVDDQTKIEVLQTNGSYLKNGDRIMNINGATASILKAERVALNFLGHLSGIATLTNQFVEKIKHTKAIILDTRKTTPTYRLIEKFAVRIGGGQNHRMGLYDMVMIKDNHIDGCGSITNAVNKVREKLEADGNSQIKIEVEVKNIEEFEEALAAEVDQILLDNMSTDMMKDCVDRNKIGIALEASGNVNLDTVKQIAETGVDFISVGQITHSVPVFDFSLRFSK